MYRQLRRHLHLHPAPNFHGSDSFTFEASDGSLDSSATVSTHCHSVNDAPTCTDPQSGTTAEDTNLIGNVVCTDVEGDTLIYSRVANAADGDVTVNADGSFTYDPDPNFNGSDSFTFQANDGTVDSNTPAFNVTVTEVNDAPIAGDDSATVAEDDSGHHRRPGQRQRRPADGDRP